MSLRVRLSLILGSAFVIIWVLAAAWMLRDLRQQMMFSLDQRLVASARMVAGLIDQLPQPLAAKGEDAHFFRRPVQRAGRHGLPGEFTAGRDPGQQPQA